MDRLRDGVVGSGLSDNVSTPRSLKLEVNIARDS